MRLLRHQLYLLVWTVPQGRIADALGKSDTWLKIVAKDLDVPTPPRGYWSQQRRGRAPPRAPLPDPGRVQLSAIDLAREELLTLLDDASADAATRHELLTDQTPRQRVHAGNGAPPDGPPGPGWLAQAPTTSETIHTGDAGSGEAGSAQGQDGDKAGADAHLSDRVGDQRAETARAALLGRRRPQATVGEFLVPVPAEQLQALGDELDRHERRARFITAIESQLPQEPPRTRAVLACWIVLAREQLEAQDPVQRWIRTCSAAAAKGDWSALGRVAGP